MRHIELSVFTLGDLKDQIEKQIASGTTTDTLVFIEPSWGEACKPMRGFEFDKKMQINERGDEEAVIILSTDRKEAP